MRTTLVLLALLCLVSMAEAQTFTIGVMSVKGTIMKLPNPGTLIITDTAFVTNMMGHEDAKKVANKTGSAIYTTDGTATDKVTVTPMAAKLKGFRYDHVIVIDQDARFNGGQIIYWCQKRTD